MSATSLNTQSFYAQSERAFSHFAPGSPAPHTYGSARPKPRIVAHRDLHQKDHDKAHSISGPLLHLGVGRRFGTRLRELRKKHNLTQLAMAKTFGIDRSFISDVERGKKSISLSTLEVLALGLGITLSELFDNV